MPDSVQMTETAARLATQWDFVPTLELSGGWCSHVYANDSLVLKCPWRGEEQTSGLYAALLMEGWFGPAIHRFDPESGSILMDRIDSGTNMSEAGIDEGQARTITADLIRRLQSKVLEFDPAKLSALCMYMRIDHPIKDMLLETSPPPILIHGDLHHFNILKSNAHGWVPIDPKGILGEPCYEAIAFIRNELPNPDSLEETRLLVLDRLQFFHEALSYDIWRVAAWGMVDQLDSGDDRNQNLTRVYQEILER
jgi:streptomycin 6-kinase